jgi:hypothetical protein
MWADEVKHRRVLAWLLDAESGHGQDTLSMNSFVNLCGLDLPAGVLGRYAVRTKFPGQGSITDVMTLPRGKFAVYPDNQAFAPEGRPVINGDPSPWPTVSYCDVADAFAQVLPSVTSDAARVVLAHYIDAVSRFGGKPASGQELGDGRQYPRRYEARGKGFSS